MSQGKKHWHGAAPTAALTHIAIAERLNGKTTDWMEQESLEQYQEADRLALVHVFRLELAAMQRGDTATLAGLLDPNFTLTHITGYIQPKDEWLGQMQAKQLTYHQIEEKSISVDLHGDEARLVGHLMVDATIDGARSTWHLQLTQQVSRRKMTWIIENALGTTW